MYQLKFILVVIYFFSLTTIAYGNTGNGDNFIDLDKLYRPTSSSESLFAQKYLQLYSELKARKVKHENIEKLVKIGKSSKVFLGNVTQVNLFFDITKSKSLHPLIQKCSQLIIPHEGQKESVEKAIAIQMNKYCLEKITSQICKNPPDFKDETAVFIIDNLELLLKSDFSKHLSDLLIALKAQPQIYQKLNQEIISTIIKKHIIPDQKVLENLTLSEEFTLYLQKHNGLNPNNKHFFTSEFKSFFNDFNNNINEENFEDAIVVLNNAVAFYNENKKFIPLENAWTSFSSAGKKLVSFGLYEKAIEIFDYAYEISDTEKENDAFFNKLWVYIVSKDFDKAEKIVSKFKSENEEFNKLDSRVQYWIANIYFNLGQVETSIKLYEQLITNQPLSFYAIMALKQLANLQNNALPKLQEQINRPQKLITFSNEDFTDDFKNRLIKIKLWAEYGNDLLMNLEMNDVLTFDKKMAFIKNQNANSISQSDFDREMISLATKILINRKKHLQVFRLVHEKIDNKSLEVDQNLMKRLFPMEYYEDIKKIEKELDTSLIISLVRQESAFNPNASSIVGATGLMQLMPATAKRFQKNLKSSQLRMPETNLKIGIKYLKTLLKRYDGNIIFALAAYNAGEGNVDKWLKSTLTSDDPLINIESIPFRETRQYVKLIYRNMFFYKLLNNEEDKNSNISESFQVVLNSKD